MSDNRNYTIYRSLPANKILECPRTFYVCSTIHNRSSEKVFVLIEHLNATQ